MNTIPFPQRRQQVKSAVKVVVKLPWRKPTDTNAYKRFMVWLDDNSDWLPWFVGAFIVLLLAFIFAAGLPIPARSR